ncbi:MAG: nitroreductase family protein [Bacteroidales bacterium]|nr:nitroreductase family protein [Bacteroidales bacterium]
MNSILFNHRSIRKFKATPIAENTLQIILEAAARASNTGNMQLYSIIVTKNAALKKELCKRVHFGQAMVDEAPVVLTFCADLNRFSHWCDLRNTTPGYDNYLSFYTASIDATIAAQNACIKAEIEGLGVYYLGTTNYNTDALIEILELPKLVFPVTTLVIGYPNEQPELTERLPLNGIVHEEKYKTYTNDAINSIHLDKEQLEVNKEFVRINNTENLAQIFAEKRYTKKNNELFSEKLISDIKNQGFLK